MNAPDHAADTSVRMTRTIDAPATAVYAAWTDPAQIRRWLAPAPYKVTEAEVDARVGGRYRIAVVGPEGDMHVTTGEYRELVPGKRLVKTWVYEGPHAAADRSETLLTVEFRETAPGVTELTLRHERVPAPEDREGLRQGWSGCLAKLDELFKQEE
jgi:uncharacterized protein YndB with AHSA1/START domain